VPELPGQPAQGVQRRGCRVQGFRLLPDRQPLVRQELGAGEVRVVVRRLVFGILLLFVVGIVLVFGILLVVRVFVVRLVLFLERLVVVRDQRGLIQPLWITEGRVPAKLVSSPA
jgi:hypothetical protein